MFDFSGAPLPIRADLAVAFREVWRRLAEPGTWWTGTERVELAQVARNAYGDLPLPEGLSLAGPAIDAAALLGEMPAAVTEELIVGWEAAGLDANRYVELVAVVSRVTAVDTFHRALGLPLEALPSPKPGAPSHSLPAVAATKTKAWVPMVGPPNIPVSLSAVPAAMAALETLHGPMYLTYEEMGNPAVQRGLHRSQMELVAGMTSAINECFY
jgi:hypothetical protein